MQESISLKLVSEREWAMNNKIQLIVAILSTIPITTLARAEPSSAYVSLNEILAKTLRDVADRYNPAKGIIDECRGKRECFVQFPDAAQINKNDILHAVLDSERDMNETPPVFRGRILAEFKVLGTIDGLFKCQVNFVNEPDFTQAGRTITYPRSWLS